MKQICPLFKREFLGYFRTPVAYVILFVSVLLSVILTFFLGNFYKANFASLDRYFIFQPGVFLFLVPAVGMRLWAEEKRIGTVELIFTLPVTTLEAVFAKFLAAWAFLIVAIFLSFPLVCTVAYLGSPDWGVITTSYFGSILMAAAYLGICSFTSALTKNQVIAFVVSFVACFVLFCLGLSVFNEFLSAYLPIWAVDLIANFSFVTHFTAFTQGIIDPKDIMFFLSLTGFTLFLNVVALER